MRISVDLSSCWIRVWILLILLSCLNSNAQIGESRDPQTGRTRFCINDSWRFSRFEREADTLIYDERPKAFDRNDNKIADSRAIESNRAESSQWSLKRWVLPTANDFIRDPASHYIRPIGNPGSDFPFVQNDFDDKEWEKVNLPHDWAAALDFYKEENAIVGGGMGRLPIHGVGWYRRKLNIPASDKGKTIYLDIDGAMSYAIVWLNGKLVGGWPYGYNSFRLDLTQYVKAGQENQLAIRLDNPTNSSRWYPGGGLYRNVWLTKTNPVHVAHWGTFVKTRYVTATSAIVDLSVQLKNSSSKEQKVEIATDVFMSDRNGNKTGKKVISFANLTTSIKAGSKSDLSSSVTLAKPLLWGPYPLQEPNMYIAVTNLYINGKLVDKYETAFGIRDIQFDPLKGLYVNNQQFRIQGVNQHHDLGALGTAFNTRAAQRQLEILREMGCNAIRMAHNPPAPELLDLTDRMGFLVIDEIYDNWERGKTPLDFHLIFPDWYEADTRSFIRRDRNHPSVIAWSFGNEVGEQYTDKEGAAIAEKLGDIVREEDPTRVTTASMNYAKPNMPFPRSMGLISLNYQGEGIRDAPAYAHLKGIRTSPLYPAFRDSFPQKTIISSETASALSTRGTYLFPVTNEISAPVSDTSGGDPGNQYVSAYELYTAQFGASPDKVFATQDKYPYVAGEFVWSGWDYLGEPTPYYGARSSYSGIIDLAGFKKDRFYLYQARWRPELPMAHLLPHWTWPDRIGKVTPVHVFTSGDEAELFLNGKSMGRKEKADYEYRLRWDNIIYEPGEIKVVAYKNGKYWATDIIKTAGQATQLKLTVDRNLIKADGKDLSFVTLTVLDAGGNIVPDADLQVTFDISGPGEIVATDNGNPADLISFSSKRRNAFSGYALAIVRGNPTSKDFFTVKATAEGAKAAAITIKLQ